MLVAYRLAGLSALGSHYTASTRPRNRGADGRGSDASVLLNKGENDVASRAFLDFLMGPEAHAIIERFGYSLD
jgi:hypothetical protein